MEEYICKTCNRQLDKNNTNPVTPCEAVASPQKGVFSCLLCCYSGPKRNACKFHEDNYNYSSDVVCKAFMKISENSVEHNIQFICNQCHNKLLGYSSVTCKNCLKEVNKEDSIVFDKDQIVELPAEHSSEDQVLICKKCNAQMTVTSFVTCVCCHRDVKKKSSVLFKGHNYNYENSTVKEVLPNPSDEIVQRCKQYICKTCHSNLRIQNNREPKILKVLREKRKATAAERFLQAIHNKPEFVCTCCHCWLFKKGVIKFDEKNYDFNERIVAEALSLKVRFKIMLDADGNIRYEATKDRNGSVEYICVTCHKWLSQKNPRMPAQAVANG